MQSFLYKFRRKTAVFRTDSDVHRTERKELRQSRKTSININIHNLEAEFSLNTQKLIIRYSPYGGIQINLNFL